MATVLYGHLENITAGEDITAPALIRIDPTDGLAYLASAATATNPAQALVLTSIANGASGQAYWSGIIEWPTALTPGGAMYLSSTAGEITESKPANAQQVGYVTKNGMLVLAVGGFAPTVPPAASSFTVISADVANSNVVANTIQDVTGLSFAVTSGNTYWFRFVIDYTAAATTTGSRWSINGPSVTRLSYSSRYALAATTQTQNHGRTSYDSPAASNATSAATAGNIAIIEGFITPSASGTVIARFASEVTLSAITAKAGSFVEYKQVSP